jgi:hypothetical protein
MDLSSLASVNDAGWLWPEVVIKAHIVAEITHTWLFFGTLWKLRIIERPEQWIGIRNTEDRPTFPNRGITLQGKTYFLANRA